MPNTTKIKATLDKATSALGLVDIFNAYRPGYKGRLEARSIIHANGDHDLIKDVLWGLMENTETIRHNHHDAPKQYSDCANSPAITRIFYLYQKMIPEYINLDHQLNQLFRSASHAVRPYSSQNLDLLTRVSTSSNALKAFNSGERHGSYGRCIVRDGILTLAEKCPHQDKQRFQETLEASKLYPALKAFTPSIAQDLQKRFYEEPKGQIVLLGETFSIY